MVRTKGKRKAVPPPVAPAVADADVIDVGRDLEDVDLLDGTAVGDVTVIHVPIDGNSSVINAASSGSSSVGASGGTAREILEEAAEAYQQDPAAFDAAVAAARSGQCAAIETGPSTSDDSLVSGGDVSNAADGDPNTSTSTTGTASSGVDMDVSSDNSMVKPPMDFHESVSFLEDHVRQHFPVTARPTTLVDMPMVVQRFQKSQDVLNLHDKGNGAILAADNLTKSIKTYVNSMKSVMDHMSVSSLFCLMCLGTNIFRFMIGVFYD